MAFISSAKTSSGKEEVNTASFSTISTQVSPVSVDVATASFSHDTVCTYIASQSNGSQTRKKITRQGTDVAGFDKSNVKCFNYHKMGHFAIECRAPRSQDKGLSQVEARLVEFKNQEIKFCEKIRGLEFKVKSKDNRIERLTKELEELKKEKEGLDSKLTGFQSASKDLDTLLGSQRSNKNKEGLRYNTAPSPPFSSSLLTSQERYVLDRIT
nr:hypothetical protein [Tanacetum cinerariifolium]